MKLVKKPDDNAPTDDIDDLNDVASRPTTLTPPRHTGLLQLPQCAGVKRSGDRCENPVVPGAEFCRFHGGELPASKRMAKTRMLQMVGPALDVLAEAMQQADWPIAVKAATAILDRAGIGPHATIDVVDTSTDVLERMSDEQLENRALTLANMIRIRRMAGTVKEPTLEGEVLDGEQGVKHGAATDIEDPNDSDGTVH